VAAVQVVSVTVRWWPGREEERLVVAPPAATLADLAAALADPDGIDPDLPAVRAAVLDAAGREPHYLDPVLGGVWPWAKGTVSVEQLMWYSATPAVADACGPCLAEPDDVVPLLVAESASAGGGVEVFDPYRRTDPC
jgi:hypothetical protein